MEARVRLSSGGESSRAEVGATGGVRARADLLYLLPALFIGIVFGAYFILRYAGLWSEQDTAAFTRTITGLIESGSLIYRGAYPHGYAFPAWVATLSQVTSISPTDLFQLYLPIMGSVFLALFGFAVYRKLLGTDRLGLLAVSLLFLVPELVFSVTRGNHEKLTVTLTLLALLCLLNSFTVMVAGNRWALFFGWVVVYYLTAFILVSINSFLGSSLIVASTLTLVFAVAMTRIVRSGGEKILPVTSRLAFMVGISWLLVALVMWFVYPPAGNSLNLLRTAFEKISALFLSLTPESDPYSVTRSDWVSLTVFRVISSFRWTLFLGSLLTWIFLVPRALRRLNRIPLRHLFLLALYGAFGLQLALAVPVDFLGLSAGSNLQVRLYTYFALLAAPMMTFGLSGLMRMSRIGGRFVRVALTLLLLVLVLFSLVKATLEPTISNRWSFYRPTEVRAIRFWDEQGEYRSLWVGTENRLRTAYMVAYPQGSPNKNSLDIIDLDLQSADALRSPVIEANAVAWRSPPPTLWLEDRSYDNGEVQIFHRIPRTPFQR